MIVLLRFVIESLSDTKINALPNKVAFLRLKHFRHEKIVQLLIIPIGMLLQNIWKHLFSRVTLSYAAASFFGGKRP